MNAEGMNAEAGEMQGSEQAVDSAPIAAESVFAEAPPAVQPAQTVAPTAAHFVEAEAAPAAATAPTSVAAPALTPAAARPPAPAPVVVAPAATPYRLPTDTLTAIASDAGLQWVGSDAAKIRAVQEAMASEAKPIHVPRQPKPRATVDESPLVLVETKKDLSQVRLPFDA